jgi:hypothetical protein
VIKKAVDCLSRGGIDATASLASGKVRWQFSPLCLKTPSSEKRADLRHRRLALRSEFGLKPSDINKRCAFRDAQAHIFHREIPLGCRAKGGSWPTQLSVMLKILRFLCLCTGTVLFIAPLILALGFAFAVGEPPAEGERALFAIKMLVAGGVIGAGLILVGLPRIVVGQRRPARRLVAALLLAISAAAIARIGFSGSITVVAGPVFLAIEALAFYSFIYPASSFRSHFKKAPAATNQTDDA